MDFDPDTAGLKFAGENLTKKINLVAPTGRDRTCIIQMRDFIVR
jgi:hypothetical protein